MSASQRKRRGGAVNSRRARKRNRLVASTARRASEAEPIELEESDVEEVVDLTRESSDPVLIDLTHDDSVVIVEDVEEVVDLTRESSDPVVIDLTHDDSVVIVEDVEEVVDLTRESSDPVVIDLTHDDSVVIVEENERQRGNLRQRGQRQSNICVLISDDEDETRDNDVFVLSTARPSGTVSCLICMDGYSEILQSGRLIMSTNCGHIFCNQCLRNSLRNANSCPACRKTVTHRECHPIYI